MSSVGILQNPPIKPARATTKMTTPKIITGHCRILTQELSVSIASQIPAPITGIDNSMATKLMHPMTLLLNAIFFLACFFRSLKILRKEFERLGEMDTGEDKRT